MEQITVPAYAKINLTLDIKRKREDGYHELESLMQQVALYDDVIIRLKEENGITVSSDNPLVPVGVDNIAYKAAEAIFQRTGYNRGIDIFIKKRIPVEAGMAGGSTNAAAVLTGLNRLLSLNMGQKELMQLGVKLGADVPFCILGDTAIARGIGEALTPISSPPKMWMVLIKPNFGVSTALVYKNFDLHGEFKRPDLELVLQGIDMKSVGLIYKGLGNVLESVTLRLYPTLPELKEKLSNWGADAVLMSGSGPTICAFTGSQAQAVELAKKATENLPINYYVIVTNTVNKQEEGNH